MMRKIKHVISIFMCLVLAVPAFADGGTDNAYSPYSKFGIGTLNTQGTSFNRSLGGIGTALRNNRFINPLNPAAVTARDTLAFMADVGLVQENRIFRQDDMLSANNVFNINSIVMSFPIWRSSAFMVGISPYSTVAYSFTDSYPDGYIGTVRDSYSGFGSLYNAYVGVGATFWKRLSVGAQFQYYFGNIEKSSLRSYSQSTQRSIYNGNQMVLTAAGAKFGLQYEQPIHKDRLIIGATCSVPASLSGYNSEIGYATLSSVIDTVKNVNVDMAKGIVKIPTELSVGISYRHKDRFFAEFDYTYSDWRTSGFDEVSGFKSTGFTTNAAQSFNLGFEIVPNRNDIRYYFKRCSYRFGGYYKTDYYQFSGNKVSAGAITLGMTLPVFRWYNGISFGMEVGQRGSLKNSMIREQFVNFSVSFNIFDIWFVKPQYE